MCLQVVDAFVRSWVAWKLQRSRFPCGFSLDCFYFISKPLMCATIWIKHFKIAIMVSSSRIKHGDWFMLVSKRNQQ